MFGGASNLAEGVDRAFVFIFSVSIVLLLAITVFLIFIVIKFRRSKHKEAMQFSGSIRLEILWTIIPLIIVLIMFYFGWMGFDPMRKVPDDAMIVKAIGRMWTWNFDYGNGKISDTLVLPVNKPVKLELISEDVNHSLFIPAFRVKEDVVPGYDNYLWFIPTFEGEYDLLCTEFCGTLHWDMITKTRVVNDTAFNAWLTNLVATSEIPDPEGLMVLKANNCLACHSLDGSRLLGPSFRGSFGEEQLVETKSGDKTVIIDRAYIERSLLDPDAEIVKGYSKGLMQSYKEIITDKDIDALVEYLTTLNEDN